MRWAAAIALFGYLSLFPLVVLAFVVLGVVLSRYPEVRADVDAALQNALPLLFSDNSDQNPVDVQSVAEATVTAGFVSVVALFLAGLGWINATIEGTRRMLGALSRPRNFLLVKLEDLGALLVIGSLMLVVLVISVGVRSAGVWVLDALGIDISSGWQLQLSADLIAAVLIALVLSAFYWFSWNRPCRRWRSVLTAAILASICLGLLGRFAYLIVGRTLTNPVYGALAVAAALLLFLYFVAAIHLYFACWLAVAEGASEPSEQHAFVARTRGGSVKLPAAPARTTAGAGRRDAADDDGDG